MNMIARAGLVCALTLCTEVAGPAAAETAKPDQERIVTRRIDIVDEKGVVRMTLAAPTPDPVVGGKSYKRAFPVAGMVLFDAQGNERGGMGVADIPGSAVVLALDHENIDAVGWRVMPDGSVDFQMNQKPAVTRDAGGKTEAANGAATRIRLSVAADGAPAIALADKQDRPRLRLTVTPEGYGAVEFLDADGKVVQTFAPEAAKK